MPCHHISLYYKNIDIIKKIIDCEQIISDSDSTWSYLLESHYSCHNLDLKTHKVVGQCYP